jgi:mannose-6-phosphate isomerase-like protein (cupin superfamily)
VSEYTVIPIAEVPDALGDYPGEMCLLTEPLAAEQVALTWRRMPPGTGSRGSYGHRHKTQEELYLVASGSLTFKLGDDVVETGPGTAVRVPARTWRGIHNDTTEDAILVITSIKIDDASTDHETLDGFWPE